MKPLPKFLIEMGPLLAFFVGNWKGGVFWGTGIFMVATAVALAASWVMTRKIAKVPLFSAIFVGIFGGLTIWMHDDTFIKVKVTLINVFFGALLLGGLYYRQAVHQIRGGRGGQPAHRGMARAHAALGHLSSWWWPCSMN